MLGLVLVNLYQNREYSSDVVSIYIPIDSYSADLASSVDQVNKYYLGWLLTHDSSYKDKINDTIALINSLEEKIDNTRKDKFTDAELESWNNLKVAIAQFINLKADIEKALNQANPSSDEIKQLWTLKIQPQSIAIAAMMNNLGNNKNEQLGFIDLQGDTLSQGVSNLISRSDDLEKYVIFMLIFMIAISIPIILVISKKITGPLGEAVDAARKIAQGERKVQLVARSNDETGVLIDALAKMQESIRAGEDTLATKANETKELLESVLVTLAEVKQSVDVQASGATEQAASINQITASLDEIEKSTTQTVDKARALGKAAKKTQEKDRMGLDSVEKSIQGMKMVRDKVQIIAQNILDLSKQTQQVGEITALVTNLAQQSKMLALNASIETEKAGESGKGFAVVAAEVKNLAEQSEQSTSQVQQIREEIKRSAEKAVMVTEEGTKEVDLGMQLVDQAGEIIRSLNEVIHDATIASQQIEAAISQEGVGIEQITAGMNEINQVTASLTEGVKQTTSVIANLSNISMRLKSSVDTFKIRID